MVKAVIFDIDGTLYDYKRANDKGIEALEKYAVENLPIKAGDFRQIYDQGRKRTKELLKDQGAAYSRLLYAQHMLEQLGIKPVSHALEMERVYWDNFLASMVAFNGVRDFLLKLKAKGIQIAICTDMTAAIQHKKLRQLDVVDLIDVLVTSEEAGRDKPSVQIYQLVLDKLGIEGKEALMIGDSLERDVKGAEAMGITGVWFTSEPIEGCHCISNYTDGSVEKLCGL